MKNLEELKNNDKMKEILQNQKKKYTLVNVANAKKYTLGQHRPLIKEHHYTGVISK